MKKFIFIITALISSALSFADTNLPFTRGVNLSGWFEIWNPGHSNYRLFDREDFVHLKELGVEIIRVPIHFENLSSGKPDYKIHPLTLKYIDLACDWAEELGMYLVIDNHSYNGKFRPTNRDLEQHLVAVWTQIAKRYKDRSNYIIYEILNEPNEVTYYDWNRIQQKALDTIRSIDTKHTVVVTGSDWGGAGALSKIKNYKDDNLIYTFHFYSPMLFTHQSADWSNEYLNEVRDVPFPYDKKAMPKMPTKKYDSGKWMVTNYPQDATEQAIRKEIKLAYDFGQKYNVPVWCGELGVYNKAAPQESRQRWYKMAASILEEYKIAHTVWDYAGSFGIYKKGTHSIYPYDIDPEITKALGFKVPALAGTPVPVNNKEVKFPIIIHDDFPNRNFNMWANDEFLTSCETVKNEGYCSIKATNINQYNSIHWFFKKSLDLSSIDHSRTFITFDIMFTQKDQSIDVRFTNEETKDQLPWRISKTLRARDFELNKWQKIKIPLDQLTDSGAWQNSEQKWYPGRGEFNWSGISMLWLVAEEKPVKGTIYFDDIKLIYE